MQKMDYLSAYGGWSSGGSGSGGRGSSSGGSSSGGSSSGGTGGADIYQAMYDAGILSEGDAYAWLVSQGYNTTQSGKFAGYYADWLENMEDSVVHPYRGGQHH